MIYLYFCGFSKFLLMVMCNYWKVKKYIVFDFEFLLVGRLVFMIEVEIV